MYAASPLNKPSAEPDRATVHPFRRDAPVTSLYTRSEGVYCLRIGCITSQNKYRCGDMPRRSSRNARQCSSAATEETVHNRETDTRHDTTQCGPHPLPRQSITAHSTNSTLHRFRSSRTLLEVRSASHITQATLRIFAQAGVHRLDNILPCITSTNEAWRSPIKQAIQPSPPHGHKYARHE